jgi:hypothetical protein
MAHDRKYRRALEALADAEGWELLDKLSGRNYYVLKHPAGGVVRAPLTPDDHGNAVNKTRQKMRQVMRSLKGGTR